MTKSSTDSFLTELPQPLLPEPPNRSVGNVIFSFIDFWNINGITYKYFIVDVEELYIIFLF